MVNGLFSCLFCDEQDNAGKMAGMMRLGLIFCLVIAGFLGRAAAQSSDDVVWIQIEARPTFDSAVERLEAYAESFPDVRGFALTGGWYAIALGPFDPEDASDILRSFRLQGRIPSDSYIAQSDSYGQQYWPPGEDVLALGNLAALSTQASPSLDAPDTQPETALPATDDETPAEARRNEALLSPEDRRQLQTALQWAGFYNATIDGAFGRGTRDAMARWQNANGARATGILTTAQRTILLGQYNAILEGLDVAWVRDLDAGIEVRLPLGAVSFDRYDAPFAHYEPAGALQAKVILISQAGDQNTLASLYEVMQTLRIVPVNGKRQLNRTSFLIVGQDEDFISETDVSLADGEIKGFTLIWPTGDEARRARVLQEIRASFTRRTGVIDPASDLIATERADLIAGLEVRRPVLSRSGFYVDQLGTVVTSAEAVQNCARVTLDETYDATVASLDKNGGVAILKPRQALAPPAVAAFSPALPSLASEIAVAGYSFEGRLGAPSMTFGRLADATGLAGETDVNRLELPALPGDAGGPVFDENGNVMGMLLPQKQSARQLPEDVRFALTVDALSGVLTEAGVTAAKGRETTTLPPEDIATRGVAMTVLVSCWE